MSKNIGNKRKRKGYNVSTQTVLDKLGLDGLNILGYDEDISVKKTATFEDKVLTLDNLFKRYYSARIAGGAAQRTLEDYQKHMKWFKSFLAEYLCGFETALPNVDMIRAWISHMLTVQKLKPSTINIRLRTIKAMFNWAVSEEILSESPFKNIDLLRVPEEDFKILSQSQERKLLSVCDLNNIIGLRDALLITFLLETGVRIGECVSLLYEDLNMGEGSIIVRAENAKTRKARTVFFGIRTKKLLQYYLPWRQGVAECSNLFINEYGHPMSKNWCTERISDLGKRAKITGVRVSPHTLRHTFATRYIQKTGDPFSLRRLLGHSTMEMVNRYVNQNTDDVRKQYQKFMFND